MEIMKITTEVIVVIASMVFFYLRMAILRGKKKRYEREFALKRRKVNGRSKGAALPAAQPGSPPFGVNSWFFVAVGVLIMIAGMIMYNNMTIFGIQIITDPELLTYTKFWYIAISLGVIILAFCMKIDKPRMDED